MHIYLLKESTVTTSTGTAAAPNNADKNVIF